LQSTIEEHETALEELKAANEELVSINEELQTVNQELGAKLEQLDQANADLKNLFKSTRIAIVFLDRELAIRSFTLAVTALFSLIPTDQGRPLRSRRSARAGVRRPPPSRPSASSSSTRARHSRT
jgi:two-component system CheB/CheR fusion protein